MPGSLALQNRHFGGVSRNGISSLLKSDARKDMGVRVPPPPFDFMKASKEYFRNYYKDRKQKYIDLLGGKCSVCGSTDQLQFHHTDRNSKDIAIGKLMNYSKTKVETELSKCVLLCRRCHIKTHKEDGTWDTREGVPVTGEKHPKAKHVLCVETGKRYGCISDCAKDMGFHPYKHHIYAVCNGKRKTYKGYHFKYA